MWAHMPLLARVYALPEIYLKMIWEIPKIMGPNMDPKIWPTYCLLGGRQSLCSPRHRAPFPDRSPVGVVGPNGPAKAAKAHTSV